MIFPAAESPGEARRSRRHNLSGLDVFFGRHPFIFEGVFEGEASKNAPHINRR